MTLNIGPQHPATHGTLRIACQLDGEQVVVAEPIMGYMHRGYENSVKFAPTRNAQRSSTELIGSEALLTKCPLFSQRNASWKSKPSSAQWIRTILFELSRIANLALFLGDMGVQMVR